MHEIEHRPCSKSDLTSKTDGDADFFETSPNSEEDVKKHFHRFKCLANPENDMYLWGNYETVSTSNLMIVFDKCDNKTSAVVCKSDVQIYEWIRGKYILSLRNSKRFVQSEFDEGRILSSATTQWLPLS